MVLNTRPQEQKMIFLAQSKMIKLFQLVQFLMEDERTLGEISERLDISDRTTYRYLHMLDYTGVHIEKSFNEKFFIAMDTCPVCGKEC
jgi:predicted DNA-binding transcriptional regulator YafY